MGRQDTPKSVAPSNEDSAARALLPWPGGDRREGIDAWLRHLSDLSGIVFLEFGIGNSDREDLLQDVFLALWVNRETIREPVGWFVVSLRNRCLRFLANRRRTLDLPEVRKWERSRGAPGGATPSGEVMLSEAFATLSPAEKTLLTGRFIEGRSYRELAVQLGGAATSLRTATWRLLARLREWARTRN